MGCLVVVKGIQNVLGNVEAEVVRDPLKWLRRAALTGVVAGILLGVVIV